MHQQLAIAAAAISALMICFQLLLVIGLPLGHLAWGGGQPRVLPMKLRMGSLAAVGILAAAGWVVLARADVVAPGAGPGAIRVMTWVFGGFFFLNTLGNLASRSSAERWLMTPATALLTVCFAMVALS